MITLAAGGPHHGEKQCVLVSAITPPQTIALGQSSALVDYLAVSFTLDEGGTMTAKATVGNSDQVVETQSFRADDLTIAMRVPGSDADLLLRVDRVDSGVDPRVHLADCLRAPAG